MACNCAPPDTNGEVGATQYVQMVNEGIQVFNKTTGASVLGPDRHRDAVDRLRRRVRDQRRSATRSCSTTSSPTAGSSASSPATSVPTDECVAVSTTSDATGAWYRYDFHLGTNFFDYPKLERLARRLLHVDERLQHGGHGLPRPAAVRPRPRRRCSPATPATFITPGLQPTALGRAVCRPTSTARSCRPAGAPNPWLSTEWPTWNLFRFHVDFATPANSTFTLGGSLTPAAYTTLAASVPQLGTTDLLDNLADRLMFRLAYRRFADDHEALVGNLTVSSGGVAGVRWWEINNATSGTPTFVQQGTYQPDTTWRWMGSAAMDIVGNLAVGFSASSASINPQIRYAGRLAGDPANTLAQGEATLFAGTGSQTGTNGRWGDYSDLTVDPVDDCTFWYTQEYYATTTSFNWRTRIGNFKFPSCSTSPTFWLEVTPASQAICAPADGTYSVDVGSVLGFSNPVTLSATGNPAGTTVGFSTNPVTPPGSSTMTIGNTGAAAAGPYTIDVQGQSPDPITVHQTATLTVFNASPSAPTLLTPANGAISQPLSPSFTWSPATEAATYTLEIATDTAFTSIVHTGSGLTTTSYNGATLNSNTLYYWRVRAVNACGAGSNSAAFSFTTQLLPGDCSTGTFANIVYTQNFDAGAAGWTHSGTGDTWAISAARPHSAPSSFFGVDSTTVSDQRLVSPAIAIPAGNPPVTLKFWNYQDLEASSGGCYDGGILEVSTDGGTIWTQIGGASLLTDPYNGVVSSSFSNPLAGLNAWCGRPQPYLNSMVNLASYAGQTVQFRFRLGTDNSVGYEGWYIDDVVVQNCPNDLIFKDGFQTP